MEDYISLVNKPPIDEIYNLDLVNKPDICDDESLAHYGILGMHWGIRRYQNPDGSLTPEGKRRQEREERKKEKEHKKIMKDRKRFLENYYDLSEEDRRQADKYFEALEKMEKREMTHLSKISKERQNKIDALLAGPQIIKGVATGLTSAVAITVTATKLSKWLNTPEGQAVINFCKNMVTRR